MATRKTSKALGDDRVYGVNGTSSIERGHLVVLDAQGYAAEASVATGLVCAGVALTSADNSAGSDGDITVQVGTGAFYLDLKAGDEPTIANIGDVVYITGVAEVGATSTGRSVAGVLEAIEGTQAIVRVGTWPLQVGLLAANNLSDVGAAATARANIAANRGHFTGSKISSKASDAEVFRIVANSSGTITGLKTVINGALATADAAIQFQLNGSDVGSTTTGLVTITQSGSAAGDVDTATPLTTNLEFVAGDVISAVVEGGSTATATFNFTVEYTY
jgi:hypothetical protein